MELKFTAGAPSDGLDAGLGILVALTVRPQSDLVKSLELLG